MPSAVDEVGRRFVEETIEYWRDWVRRLAIPFEWQGAVIRAAITLQLNAFDDTGAIIAAMTTSIPEAAGTPAQLGLSLLLAARRLLRRRCAQPARRDRNDGALSRATSSASPPARRRAAAAGLSDQRRSRARRGDREVAARLSRHGAGAHRQRRLPAGPARRLRLGGPRGDARVLRRAAGASAATPRCSSGSKRSAGARSPCSTSPTPGLWELRGSLRVHTFSSVMCWAACDRLARIAARLGLADRAARVARATPSASTRFIDERCWSEARQSFVGTAGGDAARCEPAAARRPRLPRAERSALRRQPSRAIESELKRGDFVFRYVEQDDFGVPENAFIVCTFWYVNALAALGRRDEARALFERLLALPQRARPAGRARRPAHRRALGQLRADLQHGRAHQLGDPPVGPLGYGRLSPSR